MQNNHPINNADFFSQHASKLLKISPIHLLILGLAIQPKEQILSELFKMIETTH